MTQAADRTGNPQSIQLITDPAGREFGNRFSPFYDAFHLPFPSSAEGYIKSIDGPGEDRIGNSKNCLMELPAEVLDLILSHLSPAALDATRCTCVWLRRYVMSNSWVLSAVTHYDHEQSSCDRRLLDLNAAGSGDGPRKGPGSSGEIALRDLLKSLDQQSDLLSTHCDSDAWRTRFRVRSLEFTIAEAHDQSTKPGSTFHLKSAARVGSHGGCMILQMIPVHTPPRSAQPLRSVLLFFSFLPEDYPFFIGSAEHPGSQSGIEAIMMTRGKFFNHPRVLKVQIGGELKSYSIMSRFAFSKSEPHFRITELDDAQVPQYSDDLINEEFIPSPSRSPGSLPTRHLARRLIVSDPENFGTESRHMSASITFCNELIEKQGSYPGNLQKTVDCIFAHSTGGGCFCGTVVLLRPYDHCILRNATKAPTITWYGSLRIALIWQNEDHDDGRSELYLYDVPHAKTREGELAFLEHSAKAYLDFYRIQGKRVSSLGPLIGGIHSLSQVWDLAATEMARTNIEEEVNLGGLQLYQDTKMNNGYMLYQECFIWGPVDIEGKSSVECKIFDLSFADPHKLSLMVSSKGVQIRHLPDAWKFARENNRRYCACALHDDGFRITLPPIEQLLKSSERIKGQPEKNRILLFYGWKYKIVPKIDELVPGIRRNESMARQAALDRETEWFRERIRGMKKAGLSNFEIAELWSSSRWTRYGQIWKPDGWREL